MSPNKQWTRLIDISSGAEYVPSVIADGNGGIFVAGFTYGDLGESDGFIAHYDSTGNKSWTRPIGSSTWEYVQIQSVIADGNGGIFVTGSTFGDLDGQSSNGYGDGFISHYDSIGNKSWTRLIGWSSDDSIRSAIADGNGGIFVAGSTSGEIDGQSSNGGGNIFTIDSDRFIAHYDSTGNKSWTRLIGWSSYDSIRSVIPDGNGGVFVAGSTSGEIDGQSSNGGGDGFIAHFDSTGNKSWTRLIGLSTWDMINTAIADGNGGIFVAGSTSGEIDGQTNNGDIVGFIAHFDSIGNKSWTRLIGSSTWDIINTAIADGNGGIFVAGSTSGDLDGQTNNGDIDGFISHYDSIGNKSWTRLIGSSSDDSIRSAIADGNGGIFVAGSTSGEIDGQSSNGGGDGFIAHFDSIGNKSWTRLIGSSTWDIINTAIADGNGGIFVAGSTSGDLDGQSNNGSRAVFVVKLNMDNTDASDDISPPTLQSTTATRNQLILKFSEDIQIAGGGALNAAYMTVTVDGQIRKITKSQITAPDQPTIHTASQLALTLSGRSLDGAKSISVSYNPPTNGTNTGFITDLSGNRLSAITTQAVNTYSTSSSIGTNGIATAYKNLILTGSAPIKGFGNTEDNTITGNSGNNILDGGAGADTMIGGLGDDTYVVDNAGDMITELASAGTDTVQASINYTLGANLENLTLTGTTTINGTGNAFDNIITGNSGNNSIDGGAGADIMKGGVGNDNYVVDNSGDVVTENANAGTDTVRSSISFSLGLNLENLILTGSGSINGTGNTLNNSITGNSDNNILDGGLGRDTLTGQGGSDTFRFSAKPIFGASAADHITDFQAADDRLQISRSAFGMANKTTATLITVSSASALSTALGSSNTFVYDSTNGNLYWNQNGTKSGFGTGGIFAVLDNQSALSASNISLV